MKGKISRHLCLNVEDFVKINLFLFITFLLKKYITFFWNTSQIFDYKHWGKNEHYKRNCI